MGHRHCALLCPSPSPKSPWLSQKLRGTVILLFGHRHSLFCLLAHARRLLRAPGPEERLAVASAYVDAFFTETVGHFRREEEILFPLYVRHAGSTPVLKRILREHMELHGLVRALRVEAAAGDIAPEALRTLGDLLHDHVRVEERELFEEIERIVPAAELEGVSL